MRNKVEFLLLVGFRLQGKLLGPIIAMWICYSDIFSCSVSREFFPKQMRQAQISLSHFLIIAFFNHVALSQPLDILILGDTDSETEGDM